MIVKCMSKEIMEGKIKVSLSTPYEREAITRGNVIFAGTEEETNHLVVGREYEVSFAEVKEVAKPEPVTIEDFLKTDPVTMAVDKCNEIFASNKLTEDLFVDKVGTQAEGTEVPYGRRNGKLYTAATLKKIEELEKDLEEVDDDFAINEETIIIKEISIPKGYVCNPVRAVEFYGYIVYFYDGEDQANTEKVKRINVNVTETDLIAKIEKSFNCKFEIL